MFDVLSDTIEKLVLRTYYQVDEVVESCQEVVDPSNLKSYRNVVMRLRGELYLERASSFQHWMVLLF